MRLHSQCKYLMLNFVQGKNCLLTFISERHCAYADYPITSAKLEGINNKRSYGFHDQNFFLLKLLSLHHSRYKLLG